MKMVSKPPLLKCWRSRRSGSLKMLATPLLIEGLVEVHHCHSLKMSAKALLQKLFDRGDVVVDTEGVDEAPSYRRVVGGESSWFC